MRFATCQQDNQETEAGMPVASEDAAKAGSWSSRRQGPPASIEFVLGGIRLVRYSRMARTADADAAVLGKGGFGCVYRYALDASFTPPSSTDLTLSMPSATAFRNSSGRAPSPHSGFHNSRDLRHRTDLLQGDASIKPPSLVAVKLCRTPCSGSFDELQKTSLVDKKTRRAEMQDDEKKHVRIVRGEGRIFQYLQAALHASGRSRDPPLVKLLANLSPNGIGRVPHQESMDMSTDGEDGPPTRLLVFEKLIELDAERTLHGWTKSSKTWSHERVEKIAFEVMQGLQFLHEHNVTHGDLKPSNLMLDPRTGIVKIIDLGASRRFVLLSNKERNDRNAVEEQDRQALSRGKPLVRLAPELCEGLGSLTGSPYYMAPEILLQATRYVDVSGRARSVLEDYEFDYTSFLPREQWPIYQIGLSDLRRGWGIRADIWSWACTVQALLLKTVEEDQRPSSSTVSPYDFSFSRHRDEMIDPLYEKAAGEDDVPRFHQWCRVLPLLIVRVALEPVLLVPQTHGCSPGLRSALKASLRHQDLRPTADDLLESLEASRASTSRNTGARISHRNSACSPPTCYEKAIQRTLRATASEASVSPNLSGSELDGSRYATPTLSHGASSISTPQHTCETAAKCGLERTPTSDRKVHFETGSAESTFFHAPSPEQLSNAEMGHEGSNPVPQGFELVSSNRPPRSLSTTSGEACRFATANASRQALRSSFRSVRSTRSDSVAATYTAVTQPSILTSTMEGRLQSRPNTSPCMVGAEASRLQSTTISQQVCTSSGTARSLILSGNSEPTTPLHPQLSDGLGISWPLEGMHRLQLTSLGSVPRTQRGTGSVPASPITHTRGNSAPLLQTVDQRGGLLRVPSPVAVPSFLMTNGQDIGGSPTCSVGERKGSKQSSLMATLKEKQVRLKQSSMKLMGKRGSGNRSPPFTGGILADHHRAHGSINGAFGEAAQHSPSSGMMKVVGGSGQHPMMAAPQTTSRYPPELTLSSQSAGSSPHVANRRAANRTGDETTPSRPLLRRLLPWSTGL